MSNNVSAMPVAPYKSAFEAEKAFYLAFVRRDLDLMQKVWAEKETVYCLHPGTQPLVGKPAIIKSWQQIFTGPQTTELKIEHHNLTGDPKIAVHRVTEHLSMHVNNENKQQATIHSINIFQCINDYWYIIAHHSAAAPVIAKPQGATMH
jgi:ketosteroid isomerase-like protein